MNLQYGDTSKEEQFIKERGFEFVTFPKVDYKKNLDDWLAIAAACDGIISVSTALVHFAGACGQKGRDCYARTPKDHGYLEVEDTWSIACECSNFQKRSRRNGSGLSRQSCWSYC